MSNPIRFVPEIGMFTFSRGKRTCKWSTSWCRENCYFNKFYRMGWATEESDKRDNTFWRGTDSGEFVTAVKIAADFEPVPRFRFSVKGEIWLLKRDVEKVMLIALAMPETLFWVPTRAWHDGNVADLIERLIFPLPNARVLASTYAVLSRKMRKKVEIVVNEMMKDAPPSSKFIIKLLEFEGPLTQKEIINATMLPSRTVRRGLDYLINRGLVLKKPFIGDPRQSLYAINR